MTRARLARTALLCAVTCLIAADRVDAEPITTIRANGPAANRVDIVVMGDGFTAAEIASGVYRQRIEAFVAPIFAQQPYQEYASAFNVHLIDVTSNQAGADHPERGVLVDTALNGTYNCGGIQRLICVNTSLVNAVLTRTAVAANAREIVLVMVNDTEYGGSGGSVAVSSLNSAAVELILHEVGHSFGLLADEYTSQPPTCNPAEPAAVNATAQTSRTSIKWAHWIDAATPVPTGGTALGVAGLYQGAAYCPTQLYRPTYDSKMRSLGRPFEPINSEQHVRRIYNFVSPIDSVSPAVSTTIIHQGDQLSVTALRPATHQLEVSWSVDGVALASGAQFDTAGVALGAHQIVATVRDTTQFVRSDPSQLLQETATWNVTVQAAVPSANPTGLSLTSVIGNVVTIAWRAPTSTTPTSYALEGGVAPGQTLASQPTGSAATTFTFTAPTGVFFIRVHAIAPGGRSAASNEIQIAVNVPQMPSAPANLLGLANGQTLTLAWRNGLTGGTPTAVRLDVSGAVATSLMLPVAETFAFAGIPAGTYTFAVRGVNAVGTSGPSAPVTLTFPGTCTPPLTPTNLSVTTAGSTVSVAWGLPATGAAPSSYQLVVRGAFNGAFPVLTQSLTSGAPPGTYTLSVVAVNACGQSAPTVGQTITIS